MNPIACLILVCLVALVLGASKRVALLAMMAGALYLSQSQTVDLLGLNMFAIRFVEIAVFFRVVARRELSALRLNAIDRAVLLLYGYTTVVFLLRSKTEQVFQVGVALDAFLVYFSCRALIDSPEDFRWLLRSFILLLVPFVLVVAIERLQGQSPLAFMGWGAHGSIWERDGKVRCFGSFRNPTLLGTIGVGFIPLFIGMAFRRADRKWAALGTALCLVIIWAANSGGPVGGLAFGCLAWACWKLRTKMRLVRWGIVALIAAAAVLMKAPVWYLVAHVSGVTGGDGWHRAYLMDVSFQNLGRWWLAGMPTADTINWFPYWLAAANGADITNEFILFGITAGLGAMALLVLLLKRAFGALGTALQTVRASLPEDREAECFLWGLGSMLAAHIINWIGISYFDQTYVLWFLQLAAISTLSDWHVWNSSEAVMETEEHPVDDEYPDPMQITAQ